MGSKSTCKRRNRFTIAAPRASCKVQGRAPAGRLRRDVSYCSSTNDNTASIKSLQSWIPYRSRTYNYPSTPTNGTTPSSPPYRLRSSQASPLAATAKMTIAPTAERHASSSTIEMYWYKVDRGWLVMARWHHSSGTSLHCGPPHVGPNASSCRIMLHSKFISPCSILAAHRLTNHRYAPPSGIVLGHPYRCAF